MAVLPTVDERRHLSILPFYPAWEILPHEGKLPHADVISDRLQTLVALSDTFKTQNAKLKTDRDQRRRAAAKNLFARRFAKAARARLSAATKSRRST